MRDKIVKTNVFVKLKKVAAFWSTTVNKETLKHHKRTLKNISSANNVSCFLCVLQWLLYWLFKTKTHHFGGHIYLACSKSFFFLVRFFILTMWYYYYPKLVYLQKLVICPRFGVVYSVIFYHEKQQTVNDINSEL